MVQSGAPEPTEYKHPSPESAQASQPQDSWTVLVRNAASDFSRKVTESSQQLTSAVERLASDSMSILGDLAQKTE